MNRLSSKGKKRLRFEDSSVAWNAINRMSIRLNNQTKLSAPQSNRVEKSLDLRTKKNLSDKQTKQLLFLESILAEGPGWYLLCVLALSQNQICSTKIGILKALLGIIKANKDNETILHSAVQSFAVSSKIPRSTQPPRQYEPRPTTQREWVIEIASLQGITKVFDEDMCNAIRRAANRELKAITMVFPTWGAVDCVMSFIVCDRDVERLVMNLFNAELKWVDEVLRLVLPEGITAVIPNSEATLKGVSDDAVLRVLGSEIHSAIRQCEIRKRELADGKTITECVSMIITKKKAYINLSLGLQAGFEIKSKLNAEEPSLLDESEESVVGVDVTSGVA